MTAKVMQCIEAKAHPNADALRVYKFNCEDITLNVVANLETIYEVGDKAEVIFVYSTLKPGEQLVPEKLRGISSQGMAVGKTDLDVGTDVTEKHCVIHDGFVFIGWPSIGSLFNVRRDLKTQNDLRKVTYRGKVKLDGTNAGVQVNTKGEVCAQTRERLLVNGVDNLGFDKWVKSKESVFSSFKKDTDIIIFGEWCGPGIQRRISISKIPKKIFAVFAVQCFEPGRSYIIQDPKMIEDFLCSSEKLNEDDIYILPWSTELIDINYENRDVLETQVPKINNIVHAVEECDPWVKETFGVEGMGEGVVMYPITESGIVNREDFSELVFKAKGEKHKVVKVKEPVQIDPEVAASVEEFAKLFCTENRLEQIAQKVGDFDQKKTGLFIKEFIVDVQKESVAELEASNLEWKQVSKAVSSAASSWWILKVKENSMK